MVGANAHGTAQPLAFLHKRREQLCRGQQTRFSGGECEDKSQDCISTGATELASVIIMSVAMWRRIYDILRNQKTAPCFVVLDYTIDTLCHCGCDDRDGNWVLARFYYQAYH